MSITTIAFITAFLHYEFHDDKSRGLDGASAHGKKIVIDDAFAETVEVSQITTIMK